MEGFKFKGLTTRIEKMLWNKLAVLVKIVLVFILSFKTS